MKNAHKLNPLLNFLFVATFILNSCVKKNNSVPIQPQEVDKTVELNQIVATAKQVFVIAPERVLLPFENTNKEVYRDKNGEGYVLGYNILVNCPQTTNLTKYSEYNFRIEVLQKNGSYLVLDESVLQAVEIIKNPDLNKDGKIQNNEKYFSIKGSSKLKSTQITEKKVLYDYYVYDWRELVNDSNSYTGKEVVVKNLMKALKDNGMLKCSIIGTNSSTKEVLSLVEITDFEN